MLGKFGSVEIQASDHQSETAHEKNRVHRNLERNSVNVSHTSKRPFPVHLIERPNADPEDHHMTDARALSATSDGANIDIELFDGRKFRIYPQDIAELKAAKPEQLAGMELSLNGHSLRFPSLAIDLMVASLIHRRGSAATHPGDTLNQRRRSLREINQKFRGRSGGTRLTPRNRP
jgi:hypothetical protein